jgi:hypothetical protein
LEDEDEVGEYISVCVYVIWTFEIEMVVDFGGGLGLMVKGG